MTQAKDKPTLKQQILDLLADGEWHSSYEIHTSISASNVSAERCFATSTRTRISDLRKEGHNIERKHDGSNAFYYRLVKPQPVGRCYHTERLYGDEGQRRLF